MAIDAFIEDEDGATLDEVLDSEDLTGRIVALAGHSGTVCLRFVHPEGDTVFNQLQIPTLMRELEAARAFVTEERLALLGRSELESARAAGWTPSVIHALEVRNARTRVEDIHVHLDRLVALGESARGRAHTCLKFYGD